MFNAQEGNAMTATNSKPLDLAQFEGHTPGPWHVGVKQAEQIIYDGKGWAVANATVYHGKSDVAETKANARRIVACVNACEGMENPAVAISGLRSRSDNAPAMCAEVEALRAENVRLRETLRIIADSEPLETGSFVCDFDTLQSEARAALGFAK